MDYLALILKNTSLWELLALVIVMYFLCQPSLMKAITRIKVGELEIELEQLKAKVEQSEAHIGELESELQNERRLFVDFIEKFNRKPVSGLALCPMLQSNAIRHFD